MGKKSKNDNNLLVLHSSVTDDCQLNFFKNDN